jgi:2TM domain-containing protein
MQDAGNPSGETTEDAAYRRARRHVAALRGFYTHLTVFVLVNILLFAINILTSPHSLWFYWPLIGWGIGLLAHAFTVFGFGGRGWMGEDWEERKVREYMQKDGRNQ